MAGNPIPVPVSEEKILSIADLENAGSRKLPVSARGECQSDVNGVLVAMSRSKLRVGRSPFHNGLLLRCQQVAEILPPSSPCEAVLFVLQQAAETPSLGPVILMPELGFPRRGSIVRYAPRASHLII